MPVIPGRFWLWALTALAVWGVFYYKKTQGEIESAKAKLFARQRAIVAELGPRFEPLRDQVERWTMQAAGPYPGDSIDPELRGWDFRTLPGIYLRLRLADATAVARIRKVANDSLRDGFTACLFREKNPDPTAGPACKATHECPSGTFCNEQDHCVAAAQPYNLRAAYRGTRLLTDEWTLELREASDDMRMRLLGRQFEATVNDDIPLAIDLMTRAQFFLLVLDEDPEGGMPSDAGAVTAESVQSVPHPVRVALFTLKRPQNRELLRIRRTVDARLIPAGPGGSADDEVSAAQQRQANGCALALEVRAAAGLRD